MHTISARPRITARRRPRRAPVQAAPRCDLTDDCVDTLAGIVDRVGLILEQLAALVGELAQSEAATER